MHYSFYSKDALLTPTFKCLYGNRISFFVFWYFRCHHEYSIDESFNVQEREQTNKNSFSQKKEKEKIHSNGCVVLLANYGFISVDGDTEISFDM